MGRPIKLGLIQVCARAGDDYRARTDFLYAEAEACFREGAELVFFPEAYQHDPDREILYREEELTAVTRVWKERCASLAKQYHAYLVPWDYELKDGRLYNSAYVLDREGREVGRYRKVHLTASEQGRGLTGGDDFPVFSLDFGRVGLMICWDNYFPESARILGNRGADLILYPLYGDTLIPQWELKTRARAADSQVFIASCAIDPGAAFTGLIGPEGEILARLKEKGTHLLVTAELGKRVITKTDTRHAEDLRLYTQRCRRVDAYAGLTEEPEKASWAEVYLGQPPKTRLPLI